MKQCTICKLEKPVDAFERHRKQCKTCRAAIKKVHRRNWYLLDPAKRIQSTRDWRDANSSHKKAQRKKEYIKNREAAIQAAREYRKNNPDKIAAWSRRRQCAKAQRIPKWVDKEELWLIQEVYRLAKLRTQMTGIKWEVDHIIPLRGKIVSGLHVISNLQVIPAEVNKQKRNKYELA